MAGKPIEYIAIAERRLQRAGGLFALDYAMIGGMRFGGTRNMMSEAPAPSGPPNLRTAEPGGPACATCTNYRSGACTAYAKEVEPTNVCDSHQGVDESEGPEERMAGANPFEY